MGFFSWLTQDTDESIPSKYSNRDTINVTMYDDKGNSWTEKNYEGYGIFDGKDYHELLAEMNDFGPGNDYDLTFDEKREVGIDLYFHGDDTVIYPQLYSNSYLRVDELNFKEQPENCECQGFFYNQ